MATRLRPRWGGSGGVAGTPTNSSRPLTALLAGATPRRWNMYPLLAANGSSAVSSQTTASVTGPTNGIEFGGTSTPFCFVSPPIDQDVTISGTITLNLWGLESSMNANMAINARIIKVDGATGALTTIATSTRTTELGTSSAVNNFTVTPTSTACLKGDRIILVPFFDDAGTMASGFTGTFVYDGPAAASGDSWVEFTETFGVVTTNPSTQTIYPTNTASDVATAAVDREAWTSRGAGVQNDVTNSVTDTVGTTRTQVTDTAGGTVVDWWTKQLQATTLQGPILVNARAASSSGADENIAVEIAVVASDGSSPTVWGYATSAGLPSITEQVVTYYVSGPDTAISDGQRLRIRFLWVADTNVGLDGSSSGGTGTIWYAGTSGGASGDLFLTLDQTLAEYTGGGATEDAFPYVNTQGYYGW